MKSEFKTGTSKVKVKGAKKRSADLRDKPEPKPWIPDRGPGRQAKAKPVSVFSFVSYRRGGSPCPPVFTCLPAFATQGGHGDPPLQKTIFFMPFGGSFSLGYL